jgi:alpha-glucosidase
MEGGRYAADAALRGHRVRRDRDGGAALVLELSRGVAEIELAAEGVLRVRAFGAAEPPRPELALERGAWRVCASELRERPGGLSWLSPECSLRVEVDADPLCIRLEDRRGAAIAELCELAFAEPRGARIAVRCGAGERCFGFGEKTGPLDKRGSRFLLRNRDPESLDYSDPLYVSIPFLLLHRGGAAGSVGVLLESFGPSQFDVAATRPDRIRLEALHGGLDVAVFPGPAPRDVLERFTARVGRTPLPPRWALGHHQSRWSYRSERELRALAAQIRRRRIPTDVLYLDIDYMDGYRVFTWHPRRFPEPRRLLADLAAQGFRVVTIVDPGVKVDPGYAVYRDGLARGVFCRRADGGRFSLRVWPGEAALPDFDREDVRRWWAEQHAALLDAGVAGIWNDMNEPAGWSADLRLGRLMIPTRKQDLSDVVQRDPTGAPGDVSHESVRNLYGLQHCRATRAALESPPGASGPRPFLLTRSGYTGVQRYAAVWTGDNASRWSHLRGSIPMLLNLSLSGVAFCGADIGGFMRSCTPELYARWIQLGALYPFARTHSMWAARRQEPWRFGRRVERIAREALRLRMRLLPYFEGLFREAEERGAPVWRPLFYEFPEDPESASIEDQLLLGPSLLVAPVVTRGARERELYLPPGGWIAWHDGALFRGPRRLRVPAPLEHLPLFARAGSVIPTRSPVEHAGEPPEEPCVFDVFPGGDVQQTFVEDDGATTAYREGQLAKTALRLWSHAGGRLRFEIGARQGSFAIAERPLRVSVHACPPPQAVYVDGERLERGEGVPGFSHADGRVDVRLRDRGHGAAIEIAPAP